MTQAPVIDKSVIPKLILPFMNTVQTVFKKMAGVEVTVQAPHLKGQSHPSYDVSGIIGFSGDVVGTVVLSFHNEVAEKLVEAFTGMRIERTSPDFADAIGELANMIAGSAKANLGGKTNISIPSVVIGSGYTLANMSNVKCLVIPCGSPHGEFAIEICIENSQQAGK